MSRPTEKHAAMYVYQYRRYFSDGSYELTSLEEAIKSAACDFDTGDAWPVSITTGDEVLWSSVAVVDAADSLAAFAEAHNIDISAFGFEPQEVKQ